MKKITITQKKSTIGALARQKRTMEALGLRKINQTVQHELTPSIQGMVRCVEHLITIA